MRAITLFLLAALAGPAWSQELKVGAAAVPITPPVGIPMAGYYSERGARGVHDELFAKAIVIEQGGRAARRRTRPDRRATRSRRRCARARSSRACRVPGANVMISATHSHTGPIVDTKNPLRRSVRAW